MSRATARANIALAKYWGKSDTELNLPAVPSVSITLDPLCTETRVELDASLDADVFVLDGEPASSSERARVSAVLDVLRQRAGAESFAHVESVNHFPTAAGLASSASGFAALVGAASRAFGLSLDDSTMSAIARQASASAARSIYGGYVELSAGVPGDATLSANPIAPPEHWDLRVVVAKTARGRKPIGSRQAMEQSRAHSPLYEAWVDGAPASCAKIVHALLNRRFDLLAPVAEQSFLVMHAVAMASFPSVLYWQAASVAVLHAIRELRADGVEVFATMDAGPHVKAICTKRFVGQVTQRLDALEGVHETLVAEPGRGIEIVE